MALLALAMVAPGSLGAEAKTATKAKKLNVASSQTPSKKSAKTTGKSSSKVTSTSKRTRGKTTMRAGAKGAKSRGGKKSASNRGPSPESIKLHSAFIASEQLRPMAQQLTATRSAQAYSGVLSFARTHTGEAAATGYLALGHAYTLDKRYPEAEDSFRMANASGDVLDDYADYLQAQAALEAGRGADAYALLSHFAERHPDSIFNANAGAPMLLASAYLQQGNPQGALTILEPVVEAGQNNHADFRYLLGRCYQLNGNSTEAANIFRSLYKTVPLSYEATQARVQMQAMGVPLSAAERKAHADALFNAKRYSEAAAEYHDVEKNGAGLSEADTDALKIYAAVCDLKLKRLSRRDVEKLPETNDDSAALKLYLLAELSRNENDVAQHASLIETISKRYPTSRWLEEALYSAGNMYLLKRDYTNAIQQYGMLTRFFPASTYAPSAHWRTAWLNYRQRNYVEAARLMDEQILTYRGGAEIPGALYWRGRIYEDSERDFAQAANYYRAIGSAYANSYYADLARQRLTVLGVQPAATPAPALAAVRPVAVPELIDTLPEDDVRLIKARLLANAGLNEYIAPEIQASPDAAEWGLLAQAEIYSSYGEVTRAIQTMKHSGLSFISLPIEQVPDVYWHLLFPKPYWDGLVADSQKNGVDPYLVASLIRQESEFNPGVVSHANAYGLMQLLPAVGKEEAKKEGMKIDTRDLLTPSVNLELGTQYLRKALDRFGGRPEYALAAYNAGDVPVRQWLASADYKDVPEFVESIPYTETREYVQAIMRNREMYRALYSTH